MCAVTPGGLPALLRYSSATLAPSAPCSLMKACILSCKKAATEAASRPDCISTASGSKVMGRRCSLQRAAKLAASGCDAQPPTQPHRLPTEDGRQASGRLRLGDSGLEEQNRAQHYAALCCGAPPLPPDVAAVQCHLSATGGAEVLSAAFCWRMRSSRLPPMTTSAAWEADWG